MKYGVCCSTGTVSNMTVLDAIPFQDGTLLLMLWYCIAYDGLFYLPASDVEVFYIADTNLVKAFASSEC